MLSLNLSAAPANVVRIASAFTTTGLLVLLSNRTASRITLRLARFSRTASSPVVLITEMAELAGIRICERVRDVKRGRELGTDLLLDQDL